jgi:hypothetical protein
VATDFQTRVSEYLIGENRLEERARFNVKKSNFALCTLLGHLIYMVGGIEYRETEYYPGEKKGKGSEEEEEEEEKTYMRY